MAAQNYGLGRGLSSLIPPKNAKITKPNEDVNYFGAAPGEGSVKNISSTPNAGVQEVEVIKIVPNPHQPRAHFDEERLGELAESIKTHGILQPIVATKIANGYEIIVGERRFQAAKIAGLKTVPVIVRDATEQQKLELAIIENIQRHDLSAIEEARAYQELAAEFDLNQEEIAQKVGKSRSAVANKIRLLNLPVEIQKALAGGQITEGHAKAILAITNPEKQRALYELILKNNLTVRQAEDKTKEISVKSHKRLMHIDPEIKELENKLVGILGTKVKVTKSGGGGRITIEYYSDEELNNILSKIS
jgi:ParB family transcriptional regulator, chromosome partitioning protein